MSYKLTVTSRAKQDRDNALEWFRINYSQAYAARWYEGIAQAVESLRKNPMRCHKAHESGRFPFDVFELLHGSKRNKYRILFRIVGNSVVVLHLRHSAQQDLGPEDI